MRLGSREVGTEREAVIRARSTRVWAAIIWLLGSLLVFQGLRAGVAGGITVADLGVAREGVPGAEQAFQLARLTLLALCGFAILFAAPLTFRRHRGAGILWLGIVLSFASAIASSVFSERGGFGIGMLEMPLVIYAIWALPKPSPDTTIATLRAVLSVIAWGSLALLLTAPNLASQPYFGGLVDALPVRLHGITPHANILGGAMALYFVLELASRRRTTFWTWLNRVAALAALALTQSKTSIGILVAVVALSALFARGTAVRARFLRALALIAVAVAGVQFSFAEGNAIIADISSGSFTGRGRIWAETVLAWEVEPVLGYGPSLWNMDMRLSYIGTLPNPPAHAHSQLFATLGMYGILGMIALAVLTFGLLRAASAGNAATRGATTAIVLLMVGRGLTEPVWTPESVTGSALFLMGLMVVASACAQSSQTSDPVGDATRRIATRGQPVSR